MARSKPRAVLKAEPEDFRVQELPAYEPCGEGAHRYFWVTKRNASTDYLCRIVSRVLKCPKDAIGYAGLKDRWSVSRQLLSFPAEWEGVEDALASLQEVTEVTLAGLHGNKLRSGHLLGNRFEILLRGLTTGDVSHLESVAQRLQRHGWPNFYGDQRFGRANDNAEQAREMLARNRKTSRFKRRFLVSALQSELFNRYLEERLASGLWEQLLEGDLCRTLPLGPHFVTTDPALDQPRMDRFEISPTGPLFGYKMRRPSGPSAERENELLEREGLSWDQLRRQKITGARRVLRLPLPEFEWEPEPDGIRFRFSLPPGSYATVLLSEFVELELAPERNSSAVL